MIYPKLLAFGTFVMGVSAVILACQGEALLMFAAMIVAWICYDELRNLPDA